MFNKKKDKQVLSPEKKNKNLKIGVAFGGGGARGFAHLGAIKAFEEYGVEFEIRHKNKQNSAYAFKNRWFAKSSYKCTWQYKY